MKLMIFVVILVIGLKKGTDTEGGGSAVEPLRKIAHC